MSEKLRDLREYETLFVLNPELSDDAVTEAIKGFREVLEKHGAEILREDRWGKRKFSFEVKKNIRGNYNILHYVSKQEAVQELERQFRNAEAVLRFLTTVNGDVQDIEAKRAEVDKMVRERAAEKARAESERREREERAAADAAGQSDGARESAAL